MRRMLTGCWGKKNPEHFCFFLCMKWTGFWTVDRPLFISTNITHVLLIFYTHSSAKSSEVVSEIRYCWQRWMSSQSEVFLPLSFFSCSLYTWLCIVNSICCTTWIIAFSPTWTVNSIINYRPIVYTQQSEYSIQREIVLFVFLAEITQFNCIFNSKWYRVLCTGYMNWLMSETYLKKKNIEKKKLVKKNRVE